MFCAIPRDLSREMMLLVVSISTGSARNFFRAEFAPVPTADDRRINYGKIRKQNILRHKRRNIQSLPKPRKAL